MTNLASKKVLIIGGSGYLGGYLARTLSLHGATVSSLSRRGPRSIHPQNKDINWIIGSAMDAKNYKKEINEVDMVVHSVGTLVDTTITKGMKPGDPGSYEQVNRDSFLRVLEQIDTPKKVVYVSANGRPPYLHRYQSTKKQAQDALLSTPNIQGYILRPGFIYSWSTKKITLPIKYVIDVWNKMYPPLQRALNETSVLKKTLREFKTAPCTALKDMGNTVEYLLGNTVEKRVLETEDIEELSERVKREQVRKGNSGNGGNNAGKL